VRQRVKLAGQFNGVAPVVTGPPQIDPLDGAMFDGDNYLYADVQPSCLIGDPADVNAQLILKAKTQAVDAKAMKVVVLDDTAVSVRFTGSRYIEIRINTGTTTYTQIETALGLHADITANFVVVKPGSGSVVAVPQPDPLLFLEPALVQAVQDDGGLFKFTPGNRAVTLKSIALVCGAGSVVDAFIQDKGGANPRKILSALSGVADDHIVNVPFLSSEEVVIEETASGVPIGADKYVTLYLVKETVY
jgi:hypothetical protein